MTLAERRASLCSSHTDLAATDVRAQLPSLQGGWRGLLEHLAPLDSSKPKAVSVCIVITSPTAVALDEGRTSKLFQTGAGGRQGLTRTFGTSAGVHHKGIANPERGPATGALRDLNGLAVHGHHHGWRLTHCTPANKWPNIVPSDGRHGHGHGLRGGQPVGVIVPGGEVADVVDVAEEEGHGAELAQAASSRAQVLPVGPLVALHVEQRVPVVKDFGPRRTLWIIYCLTVPGHKEAVINRRGARGPHGSWQSIRAWRARKPSRTRRSKGSCLSLLARGTVKPGDTWWSR